LSYATLQDLIDRYGERELIEVADRDEPPAGAPDPVIVQRALDDATAEVDAYLSVKYATPLVTVPNAVLSATCVISRYRLHDDKATERIRADYEDAIRWLKDIAAGRALLPDLIQPGQSVGVAVRAPASVFTPELAETML
jgi:phage gp36-like protein